MAVELNNLYEDIYKDYDIRLLSNSCFGKKISWVHIVENIDFISLLHGGEFVFNSGLNYETKETQKRFIDKLIAVGAGALIVAFQENHSFPREIIAYCNRMHFPLFQAGWQAPYLDIMHHCAALILNSERTELDLSAALKNAIYFPADDKLYLNYFERNGFLRDMSYTMIILGCGSDDTSYRTERLGQLEKALRYVIRKCVIYAEKDRLIILAAGYVPSRLKKEFESFCDKNSDIYIGIGSTQNRIQDVHLSHHSAAIAYRLSYTAISGRLLCYDELGIYQLLTDVSNPAIYPAFVRDTLGKLIEYDEENDTDYLSVLKCFFEHECSILHTSEALFYHKNTLKYKMRTIKEILQYDIMSNENRVRIMTAFYILRLGEDFFEE